MKNLHKNIGIFATSLLAASSAVYIYSPVIGSHADSSATADINLAVGEVMNLTLDTNSLDLNTTPNNFVSGVINATASTNSQYGYTLTLEDVDDNTNLVHTNENIDAVVSSNFSGSKTSSEMEANTWGFSLDATNFSKIPANGSAVAIKTTNVPMTTASETTAVTFGAKVGNLTSGTYTDSVLFTIYTNGQDEPDDMQSFSCAEHEVGYMDTLIDTRNNKAYEVVKLRDGKCWMRDNLSIADITITPEDSDVTSDYHIPASLVTFTEHDNIFNNNDGDVYIDDNYGGIYSWRIAIADSSDLTAVTGEPAPSSICPKGWKLPTSDEYRDEGAEEEDFIKLLAVYADEPSRLNTDLNLSTGSNYSNPAASQASYMYPGDYWSSSTARYSGGYGAHVLRYSEISPYYGERDKDFGAQVRCVAY